MFNDGDAEELYNSCSTRLVELERLNSGSCGFHLTRTKWDPYPWITQVDSGSPAEAARLRPGECILEINGEDIVGKRISEVAERIRSGSIQVTLLVWNSGTDPQCTPESLCCGPMPQNLQRLSACMTSILAVMECPVCLDTIGPPTHQCDNGHLICLKCRSKSERCPVCRIRLSRGRSLLADQINNSIIDVFDLREESEQIRKAKMQTIFKLQGKNKKVADAKFIHSYTNKFLARLIGKSTSVDNLSSNTSTTFNVPIIRLSLDRDFGTNLKTKSLSTGEIFKSGSPSPSRSGSFYQLNGSCKNYGDKIAHHKKGLQSNPSSYHGSFEAIERKANDDPSTNPNLFSTKDEDYFYQCPYTSQCFNTIKGSEIITHFQISHDGPLVQYFKPKFRLSFASIKLQKDPCYVINTEEMIFFLRILDISNNEECLIEPNETAYPSKFVWAWILSNTEICNNFQLQIKIRNSDEKLLLSVTNEIHSLRSMTWKTVLKKRRGVFINSETLNILCSSSTDIFFDIEIIKLEIPE